MGTHLPRPGGARTRGAVPLEESTRGLEVTARSRGSRIHARTPARFVAYLGYGVRAPRPCARQGTGSINREELRMSKVRVLVGTRKGAFILTSDGKREKWNVSGPLFAGWEVYHMKGSAVDPNRIYASQTSGWFGQIIQRSDDGGKTWFQPGTPNGAPTT